MGQIPTKDQILDWSEQHLGMPHWLAHPLQAAEDEIGYLVSEAEYYTALPLSLAAGGIAIYYLKKSSKVKPV